MYNQERSKDSEEDPMEKQKKVKVEEGSQNIYDPEELKKIHMKPFLKHLSKRKTPNKNKGTNIPKYLLCIFYNNLPEFPDHQHLSRLLQLKRKGSRSKTRFDLLQIFGNHPDPRINRENQLNRIILKRLLHRNFENIFMNRHVRNKRMYFLFTKKILFRLNKPDLLDRLEI